MLAAACGLADYRAMDQVSRPMMIALAGTIVLAALWLVVLRPKAAEVADTPAAPVTAVAKAKDAAAAAEAANADPARGADGGTAAPAPTERAAAQPARKPAAADLAAGHKRQAAVVRGLSRHGGKVAFHVVPISRVGEYESITRGVTVNQSPTTLVIDRKRRSRAIVGLSERGELTQAVGDALAGRH